MRYLIFPTIYVLLIVAIIVIGITIDIPNIGDSEVYFTLSNNGENRLDVTAAPIAPGNINERINFAATDDIANIDNTQPQKYYLIIKKLFSDQPDSLTTVTTNAKLGKYEQYDIFVYNKDDSLVITVPVEIW